jgi:hypothetical protein
MACFAAMVIMKNYSFDILHNHPLCFVTLQTCLQCLIKAFLTDKNHQGKINDYLEEGPVAQLGARFNRTEEAEGSNPSRSTAEYSKSFDNWNRT